MTLQVENAAARDDHVKMLMETYGPMFQEVQLQSFCMPQNSLLIYIGPELEGSIYVCKLGLNKSQPEIARKPFHNIETLI